MLPGSILNVRTMILGYESQWFGCRLVTKDSRAQRTSLCRRFLTKDRQVQCGPLFDLSLLGEIKATVEKAADILVSPQNAMRQTLLDDATFQTISDDLRATGPQKVFQDSL